MAWFAYASSRQPGASSSLAQGKTSPIRCFGLREKNLKNGRLQFHAVSNFYDGPDRHRSFFLLPVVSTVFANLVDWSPHDAASGRSDAPAGIPDGASGLRNGSQRYRKAP